MASAAAVLRRRLLRTAMRVGGFIAVVLTRAVNLFNLCRVGIEKTGAFEWGMKLERL
jgi:hypothetical protein